MPKWSVVADVFVNINLPPWYLRYRELHRDPHHPNNPWLNLESRARVLWDLCIGQTPRGVDLEQMLREEALSQDLGNLDAAGLRRPPPPEPRNPPGCTVKSTSEVHQLIEGEKGPGGIGPLQQWVADSNRAPVPAECHQEARYPDEETVTGAVLLPSLRCLQVAAASSLTANTQVSAARPPPPLIGTTGAKVSKMQQVRFAFALVLRRRLKDVENFLLCSSSACLLVRS